MEKNLYTLLLPQVQHEQCLTISTFGQKLLFFPCNYTKVKKHKSFDKFFFLVFVDVNSKLKKSDDN